MKTLNVALLMLLIALSVTSLVISIRATKNNSLRQGVEQNNYQNSLIDKSDWARMYIKDAIYSVTDMWEVRYVVNVAISDKDKLISVFITTANGEQPKIRPGSMEVAENAIKPIAQSAISEFPWLNGYVLTVKAI